MTKKLSLLFLICILSALNINADVYEGLCGTSIWYSLDTSTGVLSITGTGAMTNYDSSSSVPWYFNTSYIKTVEISDGVTSIGSYAFYDCSKLTSITIPNSVTSIEQSAFYLCSGLTSVTIPNSVTSIGYGAFEDCSGLKEVKSEILVPFTFGSDAFSGISSNCVLVVPSGTKDAYIAKGWTQSVFKGGIKIMPIVDGIYYDFNSDTKQATVTAGENKYSGNVIIPSSVTYNDTEYSVICIGDSAFYSCDGLTSVTIPNSVTSIGSSAFYNCSKLTSITIPNSVTSIENEAFYNCYKLTSVHITDIAAWCKISFGNYLSNPLYYAHHLFMDGKKITDLVIPNSVTSIGNYAFYECSSFTSITIPNSVTSIGDYAFDLCSGLSSVISEIEEPFAFGTNAFDNISSNCVLAVPYGTKDAYIAKGWTTSVFKGGVKENKPIVDGIYYDFNSDTKQATVTAGENKYSGNVTIPSSVTFNDTEYSVTSIGKSAFEQCSGLTSVTIGNSVTSIGDYAFYYCYRLTSVTIGKNVTSIGNEAFYCTAWYNNQPDGLVYAGLVAYKYKGTMPENTEITLKEGTLGIARSAFKSCSGLTSIEIPNSVTSIGSGAFSGCSGLTNVTLNSNAVASKSYSSSSSLKNIFGTQVKEYILGEEVTSIGYSAFYGCSGLTSVTIGKNVTSIGDYAFKSCSGLTKVELNSNAVASKSYSSSSSLNNIFGTQVKEYILGEEVTSIGYSAFYGCSGLTSVTIGKNVTSIGGYAFSGCYGLTSVYITDIAAWCKISFNVNSNPLSYAHHLFMSGKEIKKLVIPNSVTSIGESAFQSCSGLTSITIPNSVTSIGSNAFYGCSGLTSVTIPNSVTSIEAHTFSDCSGLTSVTIPNSVTTIGDEAFSGCSGLTAVNITDLESWCKIKFGPYSFGSAHRLYLNGSEVTDLVIPNGVTSIGNFAFYKCSGLKSVTIPNSVTSIGYYAFYNCSGLTSVTIPNSVTSIGSYAFYNCSGLTSVTIPNSVTSIGSYAFYNCSGLTSVTCEATSVPSTGSDVFYNVPQSSATLYVPASALKAYKASSPWSSFRTIKTINYDGIYYEFNKTTKLATVIKGDEKYTGSVNIPETVVTYSGETYDVISIGEEAFYGCSGLTSIEIPDSVTSIGRSAFYGCSGLTSITIPNSVTSIGDYAFCDCFGLKSIEIPNSVTSIGGSAFAGCSGLTSVTIPNSLTSIAGGAFWNCSGLTSVTIPNSVTSIGESAFRNCSGLTSVTIPNSVTSIGDEAFRGCSGLTSVTMGKNVTSIGDNAFNNCSRLKSVTCEATSVPSTGYVFYNVPQSSATLYVPASALEDYKATAPWSDFGTIIAIPDVLRGDANSDGKVDMDDATFVTNIILGIEDATEAADVNNDGKISMPDVMFIVNYIKNGKFPDEE